jgi:hypothetical protein
MLISFARWSIGNNFLRSLELPQRVSPFFIQPQPYSFILKNNYPVLSFSVYSFAQHLVLWSTNAGQLQSSIGPLLQLIQSYSPLNILTPLHHELLRVSPSSFNLSNLNTPVRPTGVWSHTLPLDIFKNALDRSGFRAHQLGYQLRQTGARPPSKGFFLSCSSQTHTKQPTWFHRDMPSDIKII